MRTRFEHRETRENHTDLRECASTAAGRGVFRNDDVVTRHAAIGHGLREQRLGGKIGDGGVELRTEHLLDRGVRIVTENRRVIDRAPGGREIILDLLKENHVGPAAVLELCEDGGDILHFREHMRRRVAMRTVVFEERLAVGIDEILDVVDDDHERPRECDHGGRKQQRAEAENAVSHAIEPGSCSSAARTVARRRR
ncbi:MAG: hypothetical protein NVV63_06470 [Opitutus sp.]|nr:hypothetical protein [Opitutus sp.]